LVEDVKIFFVQANATKAIVAFREVSTQDEISAVAAAFGLDAISTVGHRGTVCAMHGVVAQFALDAVRASVAVFTPAAEHAVRATSAFFACIADGICRLRCEFLRQAAKPFKKSSAVNFCNELFSVHSKRYADSEALVCASIIRFYGHKQMDKLKYRRGLLVLGVALCSKAFARGLTFAD
jgi:hypothetical protein